MLCRLGLELADHRLIATRFGFNGVNPADQGFAYTLLVLLTQEVNLAWRCWGEVA